MGPSGSGKSSVVRAGLIPAIAHSDVRKLQGAEVAIIQPGRRPVEALAAVLARVITRDLAPVAKTSEFEAVIRDGATGGTHDGLARIARARGTLQAQLIVVVDQFEEVHTLVRATDEKDEAALKAAKDERSAFVRTLLQAASEPDTGVFVVLTLRSDFYGAVSEHADVSAAISKSHELVPAMAADELADAIRKPAALRGLELPEAVIDQLVRQGSTIRRRCRSCNMRCSAFGMRWSVRPVTRQSKRRLMTSYPTSAGRWLRLPCSWYRKALPTFSDGWHNL